jgi:hypothetical protein
MGRGDTVGSFVAEMHAVPVDVVHSHPPRVKVNNRGGHRARGSGRSPCPALPHTRWSSSKIVWHGGAAGGDYPPDVLLRHAAPLPGHLRPEDPEEDERALDAGDDLAIGMRHGNGVFRVTREIAGVGQQNVRSVTFSAALSLLD